MLRRVISRERLDEGIFTSASTAGKSCQIGCGIPCFCMCNSLMGLSVIVWLQTFRALSDQGRLVIEVPCSGESVKDSAGRMPNALHHLEDCVFKRNASTIMVGNFVWLGQDVCGHAGRDMQTGALMSGMRVSFIGNSSNGVLKPWEQIPAETDVPTQICDFKQSAMSASLMIEKKRYEVNWVLIQRLLFAFVMLLWSSACAFFPDSDLTHCNDSFNSGQNLRICTLALIAAIMSCFCGLLIYGLGRIGWYVFFIILAVFLAGGLVESLLEKSNSCCGRRSDEHANVDEEEPLIPQSNESATVDEEEPLMPQSYESTSDVHTEDTHNVNTEDTRSSGLYQAIFTAVIGATLGILASISVIVGVSLMRKS